jgi:hypothetical protein
MFLRATIRRKDGKERRYWNLVDNRRVSDGRVVQSHVLYLGGDQLRARVGMAQVD